MTLKLIDERLATELKVHLAQVQATITLLDGGATVPFIARYRKEATGGLDDAQLRTLETRLAYLRELDTRRRAVLASIEEQGKMTPALQAVLHAAETKQELEDLYLPFKPKRRTKAMIAQEAGLAPLAQALFQNPSLDPGVAAAPYVLRPEQNPEGGDFTTLDAVLNGVRDILSQDWAEAAQIVQSLREWVWDRAWLHTRKADVADTAALAAAASSTSALSLAGQAPERKLSAAEVEKFRDYFDYQEPLHKVPSHRALAVFRASGLGVLNLKLRLSPLLSVEEASGGVALSEAEHSKADHAMAEGMLAQWLGWSHQGRAADDFIRKCVAWTWRVKLSLTVEREVLARLREAAEKTAIGVFAQNLRSLLLAAPAGPRTVMGLDPGIRTGVKVAVVDATGKLLDTATVYPHEPRKDWDGALHTLAALCRIHGVGLIAIGNGTASRETDQLAAVLIKNLGKQGDAGTSASLRIDKIVVSEAGASVYSASELASKEFPDLDVSLRGAVSIARRVQDPLAELVKIDPKSIGVGQYQHDVSQSELARSLDAVVEDCVNAVGVDVNTASVPLLTRVSGLSAGAARAIVLRREQAGAFDSRQDLLKVSGLGAKTFEQCAGFLRIQNGSNPLDRTGVHPESYGVVQTMLAKTAKTAQTVATLMGRVEAIRSLNPQEFVSPEHGLPTIKDILRELEKPGRDPRPDFKVAQLQEGVNDIHDVREGMVLEGTVTNVVAFGAFVDIGVHQDGLVHLSQIASRYVSDASAVVKAGDIVKVRVLEVDAPRKRIGLTMRVGDAPLNTNAKINANASIQAPRGSERNQKPRADFNKQMQAKTRPQTNAPTKTDTAMAAAFANLKKR